MPVRNPQNQIPGQRYNQQNKMNCPVQEFGKPAISHIEMAQVIIYSGKLDIKKIIEVLNDTIDEPHVERNRITHNLQSVFCSFMYKMKNKSPFERGCMDYIPILLVVT